MQAQSAAINFWACGRLRKQSDAAGQRAEACSLGSAIRLGGARMDDQEMKPQRRGPAWEPSRGQPLMPAPRRRQGTK